MMRGLKRRDTWRGGSCGSNGHDMAEGVMNRPPGQILSASGAALLAGYEPIGGDALLGCRRVYREADRSKRLARIFRDWSPCRDAGPARHHSTVTSLCPHSGYY